MYTSPFDAAVSGPKSRALIISSPSSRQNQIDHPWKIVDSAAEYEGLRLFHSRNIEGSRLTDWTPLVVLEFLEYSGFRCGPVTTVIMMVQQRLALAQAAQKRIPLPQDTSRHGNFDAEDLCQRLENLRAQQKAARARHDQRRKERDARQMAASDKSLKPAQTGSHKTRRSQATNAKQKADSPGCPTVESQAKASIDKVVAMELGRTKPLVYVPQSAASAFRKTTTTNTEDRRGHHGETPMIVPETVVDDNTTTNERHSNLQDVQAIRDTRYHESGHHGSRDQVEDIRSRAGDRQTAAILSGPLYEVPRNRKWAQDDERIHVPSAIPEKMGLREKLSHFRLLSPKLKTSQILDHSAQGINDSHNASRKKSMIFSMFK